MDVWTFLVRAGDDAHLNYVDRAMLSHTCTALHSLNVQCGESFSAIVKRRLGKHFTCDQLREFWKTLRYGDAVISGSFILACLFNENWYDDIDIYENWKIAQQRVGSDPISIATHLISTDIDDFTAGMFDEDPSMVAEFAFTPMTRWLHDTTEEYTTANYNKDREHVIGPNIRNFTINGQKFQHIPVPMDPHVLIRAMFDADLLKNTFDGNRLRVWSWDLLLTRTDVVKPTGMIFRDYVFCDDGEDTIEQMHLLSDSRIEKYTQRGFHFAKHGHYDNMARYLKENARYGDRYILDSIESGEYLPIQRE